MGLSLASNELAIYIALPKELIRRLETLAAQAEPCAISRNQLAVNILTAYCDEHLPSKPEHERKLVAADIKSTIASQTWREEVCALTGIIIPPMSYMLLGQTYTGRLVPIAVECLQALNMKHEAEAGEEVDPVKLKEAEKGWE